MSIPLVIVPIVLLLSIGYLVYMRTVGVRNMEASHTRFRLAELAQRLRLTVVAGDPQFNLFIRQANVDVMRGPADGRPIHIEARAEGTPDGLPMTLSYLYRVEQKTEMGLLGGVASVRWKKWFDCRVSVRAKQSFPPFEVVSRTSPVGPIPQTQALPACLTGMPDVDATFLVTTNEPRLAQAIGPHLAKFSLFQQNAGVQIVGDGQSVAFVLRHDAAPLIASVLYYPDELSAGLNAIARAVGG